MEKKSNSITPVSLANLNIGNLINMDFDKRKQTEAKISLASNKIIQKTIYHPKNNLHKNFDVKFMNFHAKKRKNRNMNRS